MKKILVSAFAAVASAAAFAGMNNVVIAFSTPGPDKYSDGTTVVDGEKYEPVSTEDGAAFEVPVAAFGLKLSLIADSTAIKPAVEVQYTVTFDADTIAPH